MYNEREEGVLMRKQKRNVTVIFLLKKLKVLNAKIEKKIFHKIFDHSVIRKSI